MDCIDSADISIRLRALDLVVGMVSNDNLMSIVSKLMRQLRNAPPAPAGDRKARPTGHIEPEAESDDEAPEVAITSDKGSSPEVLLPDDYKIDVITRILEMCSSNNYANLVDFDWYISVLVQLVRNAPVANQSSFDEDLDSTTKSNISEKIGDELRNVAVKVKAVRSQAAAAAELILVQLYNDSTSQMNAGNGALRPISWIVGEYAADLESPENTLTALLQITQAATSADALIIYLQAVIKVFALMAGDDETPWTAERKTMMTLLMARIINTLEPLAMHPDLEVQERAVEFSELLKLAAEATAAQEPSSDSIQNDAPLLLTQAIPSLFRGQELNSVAGTAQRNVPIPSSLDLDQPINPNLHNLLRNVDIISFDEPEDDEFEVYYYQKQEPTSISSNEPAINRLGGASDEKVSSYQQGSEDSYLDPDIIARRRAERLERNKDDPFYIAPNDSASGMSTPLHNILRGNNGPDLDIDAIPIMQLDLGKTSLDPAQSKKPIKKKPRQRIQVAADETLTFSGTSTPANESGDSAEGMRPRVTRGKQSLLQVDSSHIGEFSLEGDDTTGIDFERQQREEAEMAKAMKEVERLRLEMQRANERIHAAQDVPPEGVVVKRKTKKKVKATEGEDATVVKKKKKVKKAVADDGEGEPSAAPAPDVVQPKKKKKKPKTEEAVVEQA
jgi:AP-3 complex subunit delta-1